MIHCVKIRAGDDVGFDVPGFAWHNSSTGRHLSFSGNQTWKNWNDFVVDFAHDMQSYNPVDILVFAWHLDLEFAPATSKKDEEINSRTLALIKKTEHDLYWGKRKCPKHGSSLKI